MIRIIFLLAAAIAASLCFSLSFETLVVLGRVMRNPFCSNKPRPLGPFYKKCSPGLLSQKVTIVATAKDTCTQAVRFLSHMAHMAPRGIHVIYVFPRFIGCGAVNLKTSLFEKLTVHVTDAAASPIAGFIQVRHLITTPYTLLTHNDAYVMDTYTICELMRALQAHPAAAFAAPQLYERSENGIAVPHAHHKNLHITPFGDGFAINYDIDFDLLTQRRAKDFSRGGRAQLHFMEDHMYLARTGTYDLYLDPMASFTMEYIDNILSMRLNGTFPWYVPTARVIFDVDVYKLGWRDIPYFVHKRSEEVGLQVRAYLSKKWNVTFPNTGIWNYIRYSFLADAIYEDNSLPDTWNDQFALFLSWFHSIGFNRYNNCTFEDIVHKSEHEHAAAHGVIEISRSTTATHVSNVASRDVSRILPQKTHRKLINITLEVEHIPIALRMSNDCRPAHCGMLFWDKQTCFCFVYISPYQIQHDYGVVRLLDFFKLPSRIFKFVQMRYTSSSMKGAAYVCNANDPACKMVVPLFSRTARLIKWSWFVE